MTPETSPAVPQVFAERFSKAYAEFVEAVGSAVQEAAQDPALNGNRGLLLWQTQGLPKLEKENSSVERAMALYLIGETRSIVQAASEARHLAKMLDGYDLNFAGAERGKILDRLETNVVIAAYQVCAAAGVP
ncbi:MAG: hypothetical protein ACRD25_10060 [Terracidiphilus sp.]